MTREELEKQPGNEWWRCGMLFGDQRKDRDKLGTISVPPGADPWPVYREIMNKALGTEES
jgi:hypothetical protein